MTGPTLSDPLRPPETDEPPAQFGGMGFDWSPPPRRRLTAGWDHERGAGYRFIGVWVRFGARRVWVGLDVGRVS